MKKNLVIIAPDSFKGSLTAGEVADAIDSGIKAAERGFETLKIPVADGGEGTVAALCGKNIVTLDVTGALGKPVKAFYGIAPDMSAIIEMAACAGLSLAGSSPDPSQTTTYGVGELILHAAKSGIKHITVGLGGSCTNDAGCGIAAALGVRFSDRYGNEFIPVGKTLCRVSHIDATKISPRLSECTLDVMCDISNPLYGEQGAAYVFAPQKGADDSMVKTLDEGLRSISEVIKKDLGADVSALPGGGAAGGCGAGIYAFLGGNIKNGIETVLDSVRFDSYLPETALVITGEGHFDSQSIGGKVAHGIARRTSAAGVPLVVIAGGADEVRDAYACGITAVFSIQQEPGELSEARKHTAEYLRREAENIARIFKN